MAVVEAVSMFGCVALQCMLDTAGCAGGGVLRAHRALDDAIALRGVMKYVAETFGASTLRLLQQFTRELGLTASVVQLSSVQ